MSKSNKSEFFKTQYKRKMMGNSKKIKPPLIYSNHDGENCISSKIFYPDVENFLQLVFIDPGRTSCSIRIVRNFYGSNNILLLWLGIHNFGIDVPDIITGMERELTPIMEKLRMSHHIIIESQIMKSQKNYRTFQHMISYIECQTRNRGFKPIIFEVDPALKTVFPGGPRTKRQNNGNEIKEWSNKFVRNALLCRKDWISLSVVDFSREKQEEDNIDSTNYEIIWLDYLRTLDPQIWKKNVSICETP